MKQYKARKHEILEDDRQLAVIVPNSCGKRMAWRMAQYVVDRLNADERGKELRRQHEERTAQRRSGG